MIIDAKKHTIAIDGKVYTAEELREAIEDLKAELEELKEVIGHMQVEMYYHINRSVEAKVKLKEFAQAYNLLEGTPERGGKA